MAAISLCSRDLAVNSVGERERERGRERDGTGLSSSSYKDTNPVVRALLSCPHLTLINSQRPHPQIPSHLGVGFQHRNFVGGDTNLQFITDGKLRSREVQRGHLGGSLLSFSPLPVRGAWIRVKVGMRKQGLDLPGFPLFLGPQKAESAYEPSLYIFLQ